MFKTFCRHLLTLVALLQLSGLYAQKVKSDHVIHLCEYVLSGQVLDAQTLQPIAFANIYVEEKGIGGVTDEKGHYHIEGLCEGHYTVRCSHVSCDHTEHSIFIAANTEQDFVLDHGPIALQDVTVTEKAVRPEHTQTASELDKAALSSSQGTGLGTALSQITGVSTLNTGASISKPVIQGLHSNRIVILNNGVRQEGQQWGAEHAPEIDPFIAEKLTVVKGANSVRYGAEALGGVVLVEPKALPTEAGFGGSLHLGAYSNGRTGIASGMVEGKLSKLLPLSMRLQGTLKRGGNIAAPDYVLANTGLKEYNFSYALGYDSDRFDAEIFYSQFNTQLGIFAGSHIGNLTDLENAYNSEVPLVTADFTYELGRPLQNIEHELFKAKISIATGELGELKLIYSRQFNLRQEYDAHRQFGTLDDELTDPQQQFEITTHTADAIWEHKPIANLRGSTGVQMIRQRNTTDRGGLIPDYDSWSAGLFLIERWKNYPFPIEFEAGLRADYKKLSVEENRNVTAATLEFRNVSGSFGAIYWPIAFCSRHAGRLQTLSEKDSFS
ncbi:MAG: TonB-dependent receptor plug domain-containing protein, partial [Bacteroidota bacterium]